MQVDNASFYEVRIVRSKNRRRTVGAKLIKNVMWVYAPQSMADDELNKFIDKFSKRFRKKSLKDELNRTQELKIVAENLNHQYFSGRLNIQSIEYSSQQDKIFGVCDYRTRKIRISHRLTKVPTWVRDYVIIHEMAHLIEPNHSKAFWGIVSRYKLTERARGYLMGKGFEEQEDSNDII